MYSDRDTLSFSPVGSISNIPSQYKKGSQFCIESNKKHYSLK